MAAIKSDVIVLGAGVAGVGAALHLQSRGRDVILVDKHGSAAGETSFGNAGLIEAASIFPLGFPQGLKPLLRYALNRTPEAHYQLVGLLAAAPWLFAYWRSSSPEAIARSARALAPLVLNALAEHETLMAQCGASGRLSKRGWLKLYRSEASFEKAQADARRLDPYGVPYEFISAREAGLREPSIDASHLAGAIFYSTPASVDDPAAVVKAYAALFERRGGKILQGDALSLEPTSGGWQVVTTQGSIAAPQALVALGPWSNDVLTRLGYALPLGVKRGYHMHYGLRAGFAPPTRPLLDADAGYVLAPMARGLRLTTGVEFAARDAPATPVQVDRTEPYLREIVPGVEKRLDAKPWRGARPCMPDMLPVIGPAPNHPGLWLGFGHQHLGFTLGPVTGKLVAQMMTGETPLADPAPYAATRF